MFECSGLSFGMYVNTVKQKKHSVCLTPNSVRTHTPLPIL